MDERVVTSKKCWTWYREEDAGDLRRSELNEFVENMTALNALEGEIWKMEISWKSEKVTRTSS